MASADKKEELHVLLVAFSAQGHINPMLRLGKSLLTRGLHVTLATTELVYHRMFKSSTTPTSTGDEATVPTSITTNGIQVLFFSDGLDGRETNMDHYMESMGKFGPVNLSNIIKDHFLGCSKRLACIINNPFVPWVADVAAEYKIPCACLWIQPCALYAIYYRFYNKFNQFPTLADPDMSVQLPGLPLLQAQDLPSFVLPSNTIGSMPEILSDMFQDMKKLKWVLANSFYELEKEVVDSMAELCPIKTVGPLVPPSLLGQDQNEDVGIEMWKPQDSCMEWLSHQPPSSVIYISFGSITVLSAKQMESIAKALKKSNRPFLWVIKRGEKAASDGAEELPLPQGFEEETKDQGMVVSWCPQTKVLAHPAIGCFLTHCGWNSMLEAITAGTPMIAYPQWSDQPTNAKLISDVFHIGIRLEQDSDGFVETEEVERAIEEIVGGTCSEEFKKNAAELKRAAREAVADGGSSDCNVQSFVDEIIGTAINNI
ncbi:UDP-glycosyltransferase 84B1-like [Gastrolobium bilobum]|uniref:UDP-glycosyltransferase 84B1-like n=1 Tax=Gastrolobium bilobum TaxID=150636 RepID=UPI002AB31B5B|nr:UDP-glycosyltransferase 84B1-like [Gastrolobium bilobum]